MKIFNFADSIQRPDWNFLEEQMGDLGAEWYFFTNRPQNFWERKITKPKLSRYRACVECVITAKKRKANVLISHLPQATFWTAICAKFLRLKIPHLAFSFNFTDLPSGIRRQLMCQVFKDIDSFVVYSSSEKQLYSEYFKIPAEKINVLPFAMETPKFAPENPIISSDYICAIGSEGRDFSILLAAIKQLPEIPLVIVTRPYAIQDLIFPDSVKVFTNIGSEQFWNIVRFSRFVVIPLRNSTTNCGHISIVGSMKFNKPIITTYSKGTLDYIFPGVNSLVSPPGDTKALAQNIGNLWNNNDLYLELQEGSRRLSLGNHDLSHWVNYLKQFLEDI